MHSYDLVTSPASRNYFGTIKMMKRKNYCLGETNSFASRHKIKIPAQYPLQEMSTYLPPEVLQK